MENTKSKLIPWVLGVLLFILSFFVGFHFFSFSKSSHNIFSKRVQNAILKEDDRLQKVKANLLFDFKYENISDVDLLIFNKDSLVYWNTNLIEPKLLRKRVEPNLDTIVHLNVGDYLVTSGVYDQYTFYLLSLLNTTYPIENKYFVNRFQPMPGNHQIHFGVPENEEEETFLVYSRLGKVLSRYSIDFPTAWGSSNLSFLVICIALLLLCATLLVLRLMVSRKTASQPQTNTQNPETNTPKSESSTPNSALRIPHSAFRISPWKPILLFLAMTVIVWVVFKQLFHYGFGQGFFIPTSIQVDYCFLALFIASMLLVGMAFLLRRWLGPWISGRNELLVMIGQLVFWSVLLTVVYNVEYDRFEKRQIQETAEQLSQEREPDFEQSYRQFLKDAQADSTFQAMMHSNDVMAEVMLDYMRNLLLDSVMNRYNVVLTLTWPNQELEVLPFVNANHGIDLGDSLFYIDDNTLDPNYLAVLTSTAQDTLGKSSVYLEFNKPVMPQGFGMPKLLNNEQSNPLVNSSVACYRDSLLIYKYGSYIYPNFLSDYKHPLNEFSYGLKMQHYVLQASDGKVLAISNARRGWKEITSPFVVFFFLLLVLYLLIYFVGGLHHGNSTTDSLGHRFQMVVLVALGASFFLVGPVSVFYLRELYAQKVNEMNFDRTRTLSLDITSEVDFSFLKEPGFTTALDEILRRYSETFFTDINVYDVNGKLLATTSPELAELQIQSSLMNAEAFHNMQGERMLYFVNEETMGNAVFQSSYIAIQDNTGTTLAYLNIPYFTSRSDLRSEIVHYVSTYINIVLLIIFIFIPIVLVVTRRITNPLEQLQVKMRQIDLNKSNELLEWKRNDEVGALIDQYNQLLVKLEESAAELRRTATESAWRGVARQVAHEIKNSLTPMRLSVQLLQRASEQQGGEMDERIQRTSRTLLEQIDVLSDIASSFSSYAKLPENHPQPLDLAELVGNVVDLYDNEENITFLFHVDSEADHTINGDKTNLNSAIGNIIKNAVQAIGNKPDGKIEVTLKVSETSFVISVKDNGKGIKEEDKKMIFLPNFTTKSGGSGVGLSLTFNIVQSAHGTITFESEEGVGTEFVITLPKQ